MNRYKIYPEQKLIVIKDTRVNNDTHFYDLFYAIFNDPEYREDYNWLYDGREVNWRNSCQRDIEETIHLIKDRKQEISHCIYLVINIGQMAYADAIFLTTERFVIEFFYTLSDACRFLSIEENIVNF